MKGRDYREQDLRGEDFTNKDLSWANFSKANLSGVDFSGSHLDRCEFMDADLSRTTGWNSVDFDSGVTAPGANFSHADLSNAQVTGTYFDGADFSHANLEGALLSGRFYRAKFDGAKFRDTIMLGVSIDEARFHDLKARGAIVDAQGLVDWYRNGGKLRGLPLSCANLNGIHLDGADLQEIELLRSRIQGASIKGADLRGAQLTHVQAQDSDFSHTDFSSATLKGAELQGCNLMGADLSGADLTQAKLISANLTSAILSDADLSWADLSYADLSGARLDGVIWTGTKLEGVRGLSAETLAGIESQSGPGWLVTQRRLHQQFANLASILHMPLSILLLCLTFPPFHKRKTGRFTAAVFFSTAIALSPIVFVILGDLSGGHPSVQFSSGGFWSTLVGLWSPAVWFVRITSFVALVLVLSQFGLTRLHPFAPIHRRGSAVLILNLINCLFALVMAFVLAPRA